VRGSSPGGYGAANIALRVLAVVIVGVAIGLPVFTYLHPLNTRPQVGAQEKPPKLKPSDLRNIPRVVAFKGGIPVLTYHGIADEGGRYTVTPHEFAAQMAGLHQAGFHTVSDRQFAEYLTGRPVRLPVRPIFITFDDGIKSLWTRADLVLANYGYRGTVYLITGRVGTKQPYYLTWQEVDKMRRTGRWDFGSHTRNGHVRLPINDRGSVGPFMTNELWLPDQHRVETLAEYRRRVVSDLDGSIGDMAAHHLPHPAGFADPFSGTTGVSNDPRILPLLLGIELRRFRTLVNDIEPPFFATRAGARGYLRRIEVFRNTSARGIVRTVIEAARRTPGVTPRDVAG
jgi:biofilm PGA synthesis lipoprotein PgaB